MLIRNNVFTSNQNFQIIIDGYTVQLNITKNLITENSSPIGLIKLSGTEKNFFIYNNRIEENEASYIFDIEANSQADNDLDIESLIVDNTIQNNRVQRSPRSQGSPRDAAALFVHNSPSTYTIALRGLQNFTINRNILINRHFDYEFVGAMSTSCLNSTINSLYNYWGTDNSTLVKQRIFDMHEWNNHALVNFVPFCTDKYCESLSRAYPDYSILQNLNNYILGGLIEADLRLTPGLMPYQVRSDLTIMPGATLHIEPGVELEFYPNVGVLVLGDLKADGNRDNMIKMRPVLKSENRIPYYSRFHDKSRLDMTALDSFYVNSTRRLRLFNGLTENEGFVQIYNSTLRVWTMVCDPQFTLAAAMVVCRQSGKEDRNVLVRDLYYYMAENAQLPVWNQSFVCRGGEKSLAECDTFANYRADLCLKKSNFVYVMCNEYTLEQQGFEHSWGGKWIILKVKLFLLF